MCREIFDRVKVGQPPLSEEIEPYFCKAITLGRQDAFAILEGFLRRCPLPLEDRERMLSLLETCDDMLLGLVIDKASVNWVIGAFLVMLCYALGPRMLPHIEPCMAHGVATGKSRAPNAIRVSTAVSSFVKKKHAITEI